MSHHAEANYVCPICLGVKKIESEETHLKKSDLVFSDEIVSAFINSFWVGENKGHVIVVPNQHYENIYDLPLEVGQHIFKVTQKISQAMKKAYTCDGITLRQNNEPAGDQHAFHFHLHIFPRYENDEFNQKAALSKQLSEPDERKLYAEKLKQFL